MSATTQPAEQNTMLADSVDVEFTGNKIILPVVNGKPMSYEEGCVWMQRMKEREEKKVAVYHELHGSVLDGAIALHRAIADKYGWSQGVPTPGFFSSKPPAQIGIPVGPNETMNVLWGRIEIPGIEGFINTGMKHNVFGLPVPVFTVSGEVKQKHIEDIKDIIALARKFLKDQSIYKGKSVRLSFNWEEEDEPYDMLDHAPKFMDLSGVDEDNLIFGEEVKSALEIGLFAPIEHTDACRKNKVPLKRGVLLHGPYGTGKTLSAYVTAKKAERNGWTFIYLENVRDLKKGLKFAAQYAPAVLFAEDIDRAITGDRSTSMDEVLNTLDGVDTKGQEIITVLTTNHLENINPAMLRPGRLDTLVEVLPPDAKAAEKLVKMYARGLLEDGVDLKKIGKTLQGKIPAFIREVTERAKISAIYRTGKDDIEGLVLQSDLLDAAKAMENHARLLTKKQKPLELDNFSLKFGKDEYGDIEIKAVGMAERQEQEQEELPIAAE